MQISILKVFISCILGYILLILTRNWNFLTNCCPRLKIEKFIELTNCSFLRIHWRLSTILRTSKKLYEVVLSGMYKYVYSGSIFNTLYIEMIRNVKKIFSDKINGTKNALLFLWRALTHLSFTFPLSYFYELKYKVCLSKTECGSFHFQFRFVFIKV